MSQDQNRSPDSSGRSDAEAEHLLPGQGPDEERPIEVKRAPRLRSGKHDDQESED